MEKPKKSVNMKLEIKRKSKVIWKIGDETEANLETNGKILRK
jgi:hypothetical protein